MGTLWFVTALGSPGWRLDADVVEAALKESLPTVDVEREGGSRPALVWTHSHVERWMSGRFAIDEPDAVEFKGRPELIVDHALVVSRLLADDASVVLANDQGEIYDLRRLSDRGALLAAIHGVEDGR